MRFTLADNLDLRHGEGTVDPTVLVSCIINAPSIRMHALRPDVTGWPGLYLAQVTECDVVLTDVPVVGLQIALERAAADGFEARCRAVVADGAKLPFRESSFDALSHSDVLCCMPAKLSMLQACRRVACTDARMVFSVIAPAASLSASEHQAAIEFGPEFVDVDRDYALLLEQSGWRVQERIDVTAEIAQSIRTSLEGMKLSD